MLKRWIGELLDQKIRTVNMLGCHDGIPVLDLKGLLPEERIQALIATIKGRGGYVKDLHGAKNIYYQVNATYFSALGESEARLLLARAIQLFMPGKPQVWYLDLFAGRNDHAAVERAGEGGHKEINRTQPVRRGHHRRPGAAGGHPPAGAPAVPEHLRRVRLRRHLRGRRDQPADAADHLESGRLHRHPRRRPRRGDLHDHRHRARTAPPQPSSRTRTG